MPNLYGILIYVFVCIHVFVRTHVRTVRTVRTYVRKQLESHTDNGESLWYSLLHVCMYVSTYDLKESPILTMPGLHGILPYVFVRMYAYVRMYIRAYVCTHTNKV